MDCYAKIVNLCEKELEEISRNTNEQFHNMEELKKADLCMHTIKSAYGAMAMMEQYGEGEYSQRGYSQAGYSRRGYSRGDGYEVDPPATHDRMGRLPGYAYRGGNSYGGDETEEFAEALEQAMRSAPTEQERENIRGMLRKLRK